jgi:hypothetical protein
MVKANSCPALMHTTALVAPAAKPFVVVAVHVRPRVDDAYLVRAKMAWALRALVGFRRPKLESRYSPRMQEPPPALEAPPAVEYETHPFLEQLESSYPPRRGVATKQPLHTLERGPCC